MRFFSLFLVLSFLFAAFFGSCVFAQSDHTHETEFDFEWYGITEAHSGEYVSWNAGKVNNKYDFPSMVVTFVPFTRAQVGAGASDTLEAVSEVSVKAALTGAKSAALELIHHEDGAHCVDVTPCDVIVPSATTCYRLKFDGRSFLSSFKIHMNSPDIFAVAAYSEHVPEEFVSAVDYFIDSNGAVRSFLYQEFNHEHNHDDHPQADNKKINAVGKKVNALKNKINKH